MLLHEVIELLAVGESIVREAWTHEDGYLQLLKGMSHIWKIMLHPNPNAGNYIFSLADLVASDWKKYNHQEAVPSVIEETAL